MTVDVVIAGGAAIGSATAHFLATQRAFTGNIVVVEPDPTYAFAASARSAASIRQQFSSGEGWFDGYALLRALRVDNERRGVRYVRDRVEAVIMEGTSSCFRANARCSCSRAPTHLHAVPWTIRRSHLAGAGPSGSRLRRGTRREFVGGALREHNII
jgi:glycine/D-amino acid oxidase-like deaminating enzyme